MDVSARTETRRVPRGTARPVFFDLLRIRFPVTAIVSIGHRVSGVVLALFVPVLAYLLQLSLEGAERFSDVVALLQHLPVRFVIVLLAWALAHHVLAGVRHLLFDVHLGTRLGAARASAWAVFAIELLVVLLAAVTMV